MIKLKKSGGSRYLSGFYLALFTKDKILLTSFFIVLFVYNFLYCTPPRPPCNSSSMPLNKTQHSLALSSFSETDRLVQVPSPESDNAIAYIYYWVFRKYSRAHQTVRSIHYLKYLNGIIFCLYPLMNSHF